MAEKPSVIDTRRDQIFPVLGSHDFARLKRFGEIRTFAPGTALMKAGEVAPGLAFVLKGTIDVRQGGAISQRLCQRQDPDHYALGQLAAPLYIAAATVWFHDLLHPDGKPYRAREVATIKALSSAPKSVVPD